MTDYAQYAPSNAAGMFVAAPVRGAGGNFAGCVVIQIALADLNELMTDRAELGRTGEQYVVRHDKRMLTESRFVADAALHQVVDTVAADRALSGQAGVDLIADYRGIQVASAYTSIDLGAVRWAIIVEIDVDEIVAGLSDAERRALLAEVADVIDRGIDSGRVSLELLGPTRDAADIARFQETKGRRFIEVATGQFAVDDGADLLFTKGVATCTAVTIAGPEFAYLAHLSPVDVSYGLDAATRQALGSLATDRIGEMCDQIAARPGFDQRDKRKLVIGIFAVHSESFASIVQALQVRGIQLDQIRFVHNRQPVSLTLVFDHAHGAAYSLWQHSAAPQASDRGKFHNIYGVIKPVSAIISDILRQRVDRGDDRLV